ncbi:MAG: hypothetical protein J6Q48_02970 [Bacteroidaceae bacterium]|nr:hypothetical protein [Bacteroidaceae bacterium]
MKSLAKGLNKERVFNVDTSDFDYIKLADLYERDGEGASYVIRAAYIGNKSEYADESPLLAIDDFYVNLPQHQLDVVKDILSDRVYINAINNGQLGFYIEAYDKKLKSGAVKTCYKAIFIDIDAGAGL